MSKGKLRWGDTIDDEDVLPSNTVKGPDENGIKTVVEYYKNDKGEAMKRTSRIKVVPVEKKVYKITEQRKLWPRFGAAAKETAADSVTVQQNEDIPFERVRQQKQTQQEKKATDMQQVLATADKSVISGSIKDILYQKRMARELLRAKGLMAEASKPPDENDSKPSILGAPKAGSYVPPSMRSGARPGGGDTDPSARKRDDNSIRVSNLSEEVTEGDLGELFRPFGSVSRVFLAVDKITGENRGFAFINYHSREDAERAIRALNGFGYDNLILRVEWAGDRRDPRRD